jgi:metal-responsive CopG/Arc/MetJ family transcriptional regulator
MPDPEADTRKMVSIRLDGDLASALDEHLALSGQSQSDFIRSALVAYLALYDLAYESWREQQSVVKPDRIVWWRRVIGAA